MTAATACDSRRRRRLIAGSIGAVAGLWMTGAGAASDRLQPWAGKPLAPAVLVDRSGATTGLEAFRGKVVVVNLWATWCAPCRQEMPSLERLRKHFSGQPLEVLAVSIGDSETRIQKFVDETKLELPILVDRDRALLRQWQVRVLPSTYVFDAKGRTRYGYVGERAWDDPHVIEALTALLPR